MKRKIVYTDAPQEIEEAIENGKIIPNFLPAPEFLVLKEADTEEVSIPLNSGSLAFYRNYARKKRITYKKLISSVLENYASKNAALL